MAQATLCPLYQVLLKLRRLSSSWGWNNADHMGKTLLSHPSGPCPKVPVFCTTAVAQELGFFSVHPAAHPTNMPYVMALVFVTPTKSALKLTPFRKAWSDEILSDPPFAQEQVQVWTCSPAVLKAKAGGAPALQGACGSHRSCHLAATQWEPLGQLDVPQLRLASTIWTLWPPELSTVPLSWGVLAAETPPARR